MKLQHPAADFFVPDGLPPDVALARTTHLAIGAHQDDLEFFAYHGIDACFGRADAWFAGVVCTNGAGSARTGLYAGCSDSDMQAIRRNEQRKAAFVGEYGVVVQLGYTSAEAKDATDPRCADDLHSILKAARPSTVYLHNPADKHSTHVAVLARSLAAVRRLPPAERPARIYGCEVWRDLDWLPEGRKVVLPVSNRTNLQAALNGVFDSQISGGKRYDLAVMGRRLANATFHESHATDKETGLIFALDLTPLAADDAPSLEDFTAALIDELAAEIRGLVRSVT